MARHDRLIDEIMERWGKPLFQNTNKIKRSMEGRWKLDEPQVDRIVSAVLEQRWKDSTKDAA